MKNFSGIVAVVMLASGLYAHPRESRITFELLKKGTNLSATDAEKLETQLKTNPDDEEARVQLLSYYAAPPAGVDLSTVKATRAKHILWLIENDPKDGLGLFQVATGVYRLHCAGDDLADPDAFRLASTAWLEQIKKHAESAEIRRAAIDAIQFCAPEQAEQILTEANDGRGLGDLYAAAVLGITGKSYLNNDPSGSDPILRERPFSEKARRLLEEARDPDLLVAAAATLLRDGAVLWADGRLDWDYTAIGNSLLAKAKAAAPDAMTLLTLPTTLPKRGERPPLTIRVGGNVQAAKLVRKVTPAYPPYARSLGIQGTVRMTALIGLDGEILFLRPDKGPAELIPASIEAVRQWKYNPTTLNGKPCYVVTVIDVNYTLSPQ
jgi:Gram-negative bacterial TonB protein C-terminal